MDFEFDWKRGERTGVPEAVLCGHKSSAQISSIVEAARQKGERLLLTRLEAAAHDELPADTRATLAYDALSRTGVVGGAIASTDSGIGIICAGTSDLPVAREAMQVLAFCGHAAPLIADVGVAGLWRLAARLEEVRRFRIVIAVAGMEGALFSVLGGLVAAPVIAVPTSVGYGVAAGGGVALKAALASCAPGVVAVNIDNGFGAAAAAIKMLRAARLSPRPDRTGS